MQSDPHPVLNIKGKDRQIFLNSYKKNRWLEAVRASDSMTASS